MISVEGKYGQKLGGVKIGKKQHRYMHNNDPCLLNNGKTFSVFIAFQDEFRYHTDEKYTVHYEKISNFLIMCYVLKSNTNVEDTLGKIMDKSRERDAQNGSFSPKEKVANFENIFLGNFVSVVIILNRVAQVLLYHFKIARKCKLANH